jgi:hypothetical protein
MVSKARIRLAGIAIAAVGLLATDAALARNRHLLAQYGHKQNPHTLSIQERLGNQPIDPTVSGVWSNLAHAFPGTGGNGPATALLMTDASVIMIDICTSNWYRLMPNNIGSYINGTWSVAAVGDNGHLPAMIGSGTAPDGYGPEFFASAVLSNGNLIVQGGEAEASAPPPVSKCPNTSPNPADSLKGSLYNPFTNTWARVLPPAGWNKIGDSMAVLLGANAITGGFASSAYMVGNGPDVAPQNTQFAVKTIDHLADTTPYTIASTGKADSNSEEGWVLLANGQLLVVDTQNGTAAERFDPQQRSWVAAGNTPVFLGNNGGLPIVPEMGPGVGIGFNMAVQFGANPNCAVFTFPNQWIRGPQAAGAPTGQCFPNNDETADGPAALLPNGNILVQTSNFFNAPSLFWEFGSDGVSPQTPGVGTLTAVNAPPCATRVAAFQSRMLVIPTGEILWDAGLFDTTNKLVNCTFIYTPNAGDGTFNNVMRPPPHITTISSTTLTRGNTFTLTGSILRGVSQGATYGDDAQMDTNYPMVRITNNTSNHVCWGRTHDWAILTSTQFDVPPAVTPAANWPLIENPCDPGPSTLVVITNGLVSNPIAVTIN